MTGMLTLFLPDGRQEKNIVFEVGFPKPGVLFYRRTKDGPAVFTTLTYVFEEKQ